MMYGGKRFRDGSALMIVLAGASAIAMMHAGCGGSDTPTSPSGSGGTGGSGGNGSGAYTPGMTNSSSTGTGGSGTGASTTTSSEDGGSTPGSGGSGGSTSSTTTTGLGGFGGAAAWPDCSLGQPAGSTAETIAQVWQADPAQPTPIWLENVYVTAVSGEGCVDGTACQIFLQQDATYANLAAAEKHALKLFASKRTSMHFAGVAVGDLLNVYGHAWRNTQNGQNELEIEVTLVNPGCFAKISGGNTITPVALNKLEDIVKENYEEVGPLFVEVTSSPKIHGKPKTPAATFGIIDNSLNLDAGTADLVSLSPTFLQAGTFPTGLGGLQEGVTTTFAHVIGVYGLFVPPTPPVTKYKEIYPRVDADYPHVP